MPEKRDILGRLKDDGYRLTRARKAIIDVFLKAGAPLSAPELMDALEKRKVSVNKTTVYREVDFLKGREMIREVQLGDGLRRYELWSGDHHHHLVCVRCDHIECLELEGCLDGLEERIASEKNFSLIEHSLEFFGLCEGCR